MTKTQSNITVKTMGFARYNKRQNVTTEQMIEACLHWRKEFLATQEGVVMHRFLANTKGQFADAIMAVDDDAFQRMSKNHPAAPSSQAFFALIDPTSLTLSKNDILQQGVVPPSDFSCIEYGTFQPKSDIDFTETAMLRESRRIEEDYLTGFDEPRAHFLARTAAGHYAEIAFVHTLGAARVICDGYRESQACAGLLGMFEPASVDLDFWYVLA